MTSDASIILQNEYDRARVANTDFALHVPKLRELADQCSHVTAMGVRDGQSTRALLASSAKTIRSYDLRIDPYVDFLFGLSRTIGTDATYAIGNTLEIHIEATDLLFIDTAHTYAQLSAELARHANKVKHFLVFHNTHYPYGLELLPAILEFLAANSQWRVKYHTGECQGFTVLQRIR